MDDDAGGAEDDDAGGVEDDDAGGAEDDDAGVVDDDADGVDKGGKTRAPCDEKWGKEGRMEQRMRECRSVVSLGLHIPPLSDSP